MNTYLPLLQSLSLNRKTKLEEDRIAILENNTNIIIEGISQLQLCINTLMESKEVASPIPDNISNTST